MKYGIYKFALDCGKNTYWIFNLKEDEAALADGYERITTTKTDKEAREIADNLYKYGQIA